MIVLSVDGLKMLRETLCRAQSALGSFLLVEELSYVPEDIKRIQGVIDQIDAMRPLGSNGRHGDLHTPDCECFPPEGFYRVPVRFCTVPETVVHPMHMWVFDHRIEPPQNRWAWCGGRE